MNRCWLHNPDERPTFSELVSMVTKILEPIAGYLDLKTITGIVANTQEDKGHMKQKVDSSTSLDAPALSHGVTTPVGITIQLDRTDSADSVQSSTSPSQPSQTEPATTQSNGAPRVVTSGRESTGGSDGDVSDAEKAIAMTAASTSSTDV